MSLGTRSNITCARCGVARVVGATHCPCSELSRVSLGERTNCKVFVYGRICSQTTDSPVIGGHDVLLDAAHDLLDSIV